MTSQTINTKMRIIAPDDGYALTDGVTYTTGTVYLAWNADPSAWREIPESEVPPQEELPKPPRIFSKLLLEDNLFNEGVLDAVDAFIDSQTVTNEIGQTMPLRRKYDTALEFSEAHPLFKPAVDEIRRLLGWTEEKADEILEKSVAQ